MYMCLPSSSTLMRSLGEAGEIEPETEAFLLENEIDSGDFTPEALDCLPKNLPWTLPKVLPSMISLEHISLRKPHINKLNRKYSVE